LPFGDEPHRTRGPPHLRVRGARGIDAKDFDRVTRPDLQYGELAENSGLFLSCDVPPMCQIWKTGKQMIGN